MIMVFEQAVRLMPAGVERWVWFADMTGFGMRDMSPVRPKRMSAREAGIPATAAASKVP
jgi:hypothetical protein